MKFLQKIQNTITGKSEIERLEQREALKEIRKDVNSARLRTQREEAVKYAIELEKHKYKTRLEQAKKPKSSFFNGSSGSGGFNLGNTFGGLFPTQSKGKKQKQFDVITGKWK